MGEGDAGVEATDGSAEAADGAPMSAAAGFVYVTMGGGAGLAKFDGSQNQQTAMGRVAIKTANRIAPCSSMLARNELVLDICPRASTTRLWRLSLIDRRHTSSSHIFIVARRGRA